MQGWSRTKQRRAQLRAGRRTTLVSVLAATILLIVTTTASAVTTSGGVTATDLSVLQQRTCGATTYVPSSTPQLRASVPQQPDFHYVAAQFQLLGAPDRHVVADSGSIETMLGTVTTWSAPTVADGRYVFRIRLQLDSHVPASPWGAWAVSPPFVVDVTLPADPTSITSTDFPEELYGEPTGLSPDGSVTGPSRGSITFLGGADTKAFVYSWFGAFFGVTPCPATTSDPSGGEILTTGGRAVLPVPPELQAGFHQLYIRTVDRAGNWSSGTLSYFFSIAPYIAGATPGSDRAEAESVPVTTRATTYVERRSSSSRGAERVTVTSRPGQRVALQVTAPQDATYGIQLAGTEGDHFGTVNALVDGVVQLDPHTGAPLLIDLYRATAQHIEVFVGSVALTAGTHTVTLVTIAPNPFSRSVRDHGVVDHGNSIELDFLRLVQFP